MPSSFRLPLLAVAFPLACITWTGPLRAEVKPNGLFSDGMVLQREAKVPVWGTAAPGEKIDVSLGERHSDVVAAANGKWRAELDNLPPGGPFTLRIAAGNDITIRDVLVGDVWLCSGQSNMAFSMSSLASGPYAADLTSADFPLIRRGPYRVLLRSRRSTPRKSHGPPVRRQP